LAEIRKIAENFYKHNSKISIENSLSFPRNRQKIIISTIMTSLATMFTLRQWRRQWWSVMESK